MRPDYTCLRKVPRFGLNYESTFKRKCIYCGQQLEIPTLFPKEPMGTQWWGWDFRIITKMPNSVPAMSYVECDFVKINGELLPHFEPHHSWCMPCSVNQRRHDVCILLTEGDTVWTDDYGGK
jgi:hypothetical protein